jgi:hypothetical protein
MKPIFNERAQENNPEGPFDVLLQLLFPITLILAFVVVTELGVWKRQYTELCAQTITTPQGISNGLSDSLRISPAYRRRRACPVVCTQQHLCRTFGATDAGIVDGVELPHRLRARLESRLE